MYIDVDLLTKKIEQDWPEFLRAADLIACGLYTTRSAVCVAMTRGQAPPFIRLSPGKIIFPRSLLCDWLKKKALLVVDQNNQDKCEDVRLSDGMD